MPRKPGEMTIQYARLRALVVWRPLGKPHLSGTKTYFGVVIIEWAGLPVAAKGRGPRVQVLQQARCYLNPVLYTDS